jgi:single-strand DNA-binding protein
LRFLVSVGGYRLTTRSWDDKDTGKKMYRTEIIAETVQFGSKGGASSGGNYSEPKPAKEESNEKVQLDDNLGTIDYGDSINPEDIPF